MASRPKILNEMDFEHKLEEMDDPGKKIDFLAWQIYYQQQDISDIKRNCPVCQGRKQTAFNYTGLVGFVIAVIVGVCEWFGRR